MLSLLKGLIFGFIISVPTGPVGLLSIRRTLIYGITSGVVTGLGAIASDLVYSSVVVFGLSKIEYFFILNQDIIRIIGSVLLIVLGLVTYFSKRKYNKDTKIEDKNTLVGQWFTAFLITMTNPLQLITFTILFGTVSVEAAGKFEPLLFLAGLLVSALLWWCSLAFFVNKLKTRFEERHMNLVNKIAGGVISLTGLIIILKLHF